MSWLWSAGRVAEHTVLSLPRQHRRRGTYFGAPRSPRQAPIMYIFVSQLCDSCCWVRHLIVFVMHGWTPGQIQRLLLPACLSSKQNIELRYLISTVCIIKRRRTSCERIPLSVLAAPCHNNKWTFSKLEYGPLLLCHLYSCLVGKRLN